MPSKHPPSASYFLSEVIIGMSDGLIVPFALTAGLSRVVDSGSMIVTVGLLALTAGSVIMGLGGYLTGKTETDLYKSGSGSGEKASYSTEDAKAFFADLGLNEELQARAAEERVQDQKQLEKLLGHDEPESKNLPGGPALSGFTIGLSYALGGMVPIGPYIFIADVTTALEISVALTLLSLFVIGFLKSRITGLNPLWGALRTTLTGALAGTGAYLVAKLFTQ